MTTQAPQAVRTRRRAQSRRDHVRTDLLQPEDVGVNAQLRDRYRNVLLARRNGASSQEVVRLTIDRFCEVTGILSTDLSLFIPDAENYICRYSTTLGNEDVRGGTEPREEWQRRIQQMEVYRLIEINDSTVLDYARSILALVLTRYYFERPNIFPQQTVNCIWNMYSISNDPQTPDI
jgi:hypothetical protein